MIRYEKDQVGLRIPCPRGVDTVHSLCTRSTPRAHGPQLGARCPQPVNTVHTPARIAHTSVGVVHNDCGRCPQACGSCPHLRGRCPHPRGRCPPACGRCPPACGRCPHPRGRCPARACRHLARKLSQIVHRNRGQKILTDRLAQAYLFLAANRCDGALDSAELASLRELSSAPPVAGSRSARSGKSSIRKPMACGLQLPAGGRLHSSTCARRPLRL